MSGQPFQTLFCSFLKPPNIIVVSGNWSRGCINLLSVHRQMHMHSTHGHTHTNTAYLLPFLFNNNSCNLQLQVLRLPASDQHCDMHSSPAITFTVFTSHHINFTHFTAIYISNRHIVWLFEVLMYFLQLYISHHKTLNVVLHISLSKVISTTNFFFIPIHTTTYMTIQVPINNNYF